MKSVESSTKMRILPVAGALIFAFNDVANSQPMPISGNNVVFGYAIKNGVLQASVEQTTFEHNCTHAPCAITQLHIPSIYPDVNDSPACPWDWQSGRLRVYVDGEVVPSIDVSLREIAGVGRLASVGNNPPKDGSPFGNTYFGKTALTGGVYSTLRIPFSTSVRTSMIGPPSCNQSSYFWSIVRGIEAMPLVFSDEFLLPDQARLRTFRVDNATMAVDEEMSIISTDAATAGALAVTYFDAAGPDLSYLEGCVRLYANGALDPLYLSSGSEDYFLSGEPHYVALAVVFLLAMKSSTTATAPHVHQPHRTQQATLTS